MTKQFFGLAVATVLAVHGEASAAEMFIDGAVAHAPVTLCVSGSPTTLVAGYVVDPVAEAPAIGQRTVMHGMATVNANCGDDVTLELTIPTGARFDDTGTVVCNLIGPTGIVTPIGNKKGSPNFCRSFAQGPLVGTFGGRVFGRFSGLGLGSTFEVRVPIVFDQQFDDVPLLVSANTIIAGGIHASVLANAPFQPALNTFALGDDIGLLGSSSVGLPVAFSNDDGTFTVTNRGAGDFPGWARTPNVQRLSGDFNHDGLTDYALVGGGGWQSIPVALSDGNGKFTVTNKFVGNFGNMFGAASSAKAVAGDFNHDGYTDIALTGGSGWASIPVAFNLGGGDFTITNLSVPVFPQLAAVSGAQPMVGDYNKDGFADIALLGGAGMNTIPIAFSFGNGQFLVTNQQASNAFCGVVCSGANVPFLASLPRAKIVTGDFNVDGYTDFAMTSPFSNTSSIIVALNAGFGNFQIKTSFAGSFPTLADRDGAKLLTGDFNKDGYPDLALVGGVNMGSIPTAMSTGSGNFQFMDFVVPNFGSWASTDGVRPVVGDYDGDGYSDIALVGGMWWQSIPVARSLGFGIFAIRNGAVKRMPAWASEEGTTAISGHSDWN